MSHENTHSDNLIYPSDIFRSPPSPPPFSLLSSFFPPLFPPFFLSLPFRKARSKGKVRSTWYGSIFDTSGPSHCVKCYCSNIATVPFHPACNHSTILSKKCNIDESTIEHRIDSYFSIEDRNVASV